MTFRVVRPELAAELMLWSMLNGYAGDPEEESLICALASAVETMRAPFADRVACVSCGAQFSQRKAAAGFIIGTEPGGGYYWKPLCNDCLKLSNAALLERFAKAFKAEHPSAQRVV